jgi:stage V sporulation protein G
MAEPRETESLPRVEHAVAESRPALPVPRPVPVAEMAAADEPAITEVRIQLTKEPPILAFAAITLWDAFVVHDLRVLQRHDGSRVVLMPRLQNPDGQWSTIAHPIREDARRKIEETILRAFDEEVSRPRILEASG